MTKMRGHISRNTGFWCASCSPWEPMTRADEKREAQREIEEEMSEDSASG